MRSGLAVQRPSRTRSCATLSARHLDAGNRWVLLLSGEADVATEVMLREELAYTLTVDADHVVVDLRELAFCDVACAHLLLRTRRAVPVTLTGATGSVRRILELLDTLQVTSPRPALG